MRIAVLTANEPLYLPAFFDRLLSRRGKDVVGVFICQPVYNKQSKLAMILKYHGAFGTRNAIRLAWRVSMAGLKDKLGRGRRKGRCYSVASAARRHGCSVQYPHDVNALDFLNQLRALDVDVILSVSCPQIFRQDLIQLPARGCLNLHGADLPNYRGIMPSFWMMANGESQAGVTIFLVKPKIDMGDEVGRRLFPIYPEDTLESFIIRSKQEACDLALETLDKMEAGTLEPKPLQGEGTYFGFPTAEAYQRFRRRGRRLW